MFNSRKATMRRPLDSIFTELFMEIWRNFLNRKLVANMPQWLIMNSYTKLGYERLNHV